MNSSWVANCSTVRKKDGTVRVVQDFRGVHVSLEPSGRPGDLDSILYETEGSICFSSIDLRRESSCSKSTRMASG